MKKRKFISLITAAILSLSLLFGTFAPTVVAAEAVSKEAENGFSFSPDDGVVNYLAIGDSMANGYGMPGFYPNDKEGVFETLNELLENRGEVRGYAMNASGTWPSLLTEALQESGYSVELQNLSIAGMRLDDIMAFLDPECQIDPYTDNIYLTGDYHGGILCNAISCPVCIVSGDPKCLNGMTVIRDQYYSAIRSADLISISLGMNNFTALITNKIQVLLNAGGNRHLDSINLGDWITSEGDKLIYNYAKEQLSQYCTDNLGNFASTFIIDITDILAYGIVGFVQNYTKLYKLVRENNPDATLLFMGLSNPLEGLKLTLDNGETVDVSGMLEYVFDAANLFISTLGGDDAYFASVEVLDTMTDALSRDNINPIFASRLVGDNFVMASAPQEVQRRLIEYVVSSKEEKEIFKDSINAVKENDPALGAAYESFVNFYDAMIMASSDFDIAASSLLKMISGIDMSTVYADPFSAEAQDLLQLCVRTIFAEGVGAHVSEDGHKQFAEAAIKSLKSGYTGYDHLKHEIKRNYDYIFRNEKHAPYVHNEETSYYIALGDSATATSGSYADYISEYFNIPYTNYAKEDITVQDIIHIVKANSDDIRCADLITVNKTNYETIKFMLSGKYGTEGYLWEDVFGEELAIKIKALLVEAKLELRAKLNTLSESLFNTVYGYLEAYLFSHLYQIKYIPELVNLLRETAPNAIIAVVGSYNTFEDLTVDFDGNAVDLGKYISVFTDIINLHALSCVVNYENTAYIDVPDVKTQFTEEIGDTSTALVDFANAVIYGKLLPTEESQEYIALKIINALTFACSHDYDNDCDAECNICFEKRAVSDHKYKNACDNECDVCKSIRQIGDHLYDSECDEACNICGSTREATAHLFGDWITKRQPTLQADGEKTRTCTICQATDSEIIPKLTLSLKAESSTKKLSTGGIIAISTISIIAVGCAVFAAVWFGIKKRSFYDLTKILTKTPKKGK